MLARETGRELEVLTIGLRSDVRQGKNEYTPSLSFAKMSEIHNCVESESPSKETGMLFPADTEIIRVLEDFQMRVFLSGTLSARLAAQAGGSIAALVSDVAPSEPKGLSSPHGTSIDSLRSTLKSSDRCPQCWCDPLACSCIAEVKPPWSCPGSRSTRRSGFPVARHRKPDLTIEFLCQASKNSGFPDGISLTMRDIEQVACCAPLLPLEWRATP